MANEAADIIGMTHINDIDTKNHWPTTMMIPKFKTIIKRSIEVP